MNLREAVDKYLSVAGAFGAEMPLSGFGLPRNEVQAMIEAWDEDYHLHAHFELVAASWMSPDAPSYQINGIQYSAIVFRDTIRDALR
jgi:hypothetical protein